MYGAMLSSLLILLPGSGTPPVEEELSILLTGSFPWNTVPAESGDVWLGLYESESGCELRETELRIDDLFT